jgi:hypothetical protein
MRVPGRALQQAGVAIDLDDNSGADKGAAGGFTTHAVRTCKRSDAGASPNPLSDSGSSSSKRRQRYVGKETGSSTGKSHWHMRPRSPSCWLCHPVDAVTPSGGPPTPTPTPGRAEGQPSPPTSVPFTRGRAHCAWPFRSGSQGLGTLNVVTPHPPASPHVHVEHAEGSRASPADRPLREVAPGHTVACHLV